VNSRIYTNDSITKTEIVESVIRFISVFIAICFVIGSLCYLLMLPGKFGAAYVVEEYHQFQAEKYGNDFHIDESIEQELLDKLLIYNIDDQKFNYLKISEITTPKLYIAIENEDFVTADRYYKYGAKVSIHEILDLNFGNARLKYGFSKHNNEPSQEHLMNSLNFVIERGADINEINSSAFSGFISSGLISSRLLGKGFTPLTLSLSLSRSSLVLYLIDYLIEHGAYVDMPDGENFTPLSILCILRFVNTNELSSFEKRHEAEKRHEDELEVVNIAKKLIEHGANVNRVIMPHREGYSQTPLLLACTSPDYKSPELVDLLIKNGADVNFENEEGLKPLRVSNSAKSEEGKRIDSLLTKAGAVFLNQRDAQFF